MAKTFSAEDIKSELTLIIEKESINLAKTTEEVLYETTPVDTGHARSNWVLSRGAPYSGVSGSKAAVSEDARLKGYNDLAKYKLSDGQIYLTNNVDYIERLNEGWSKQAPSKFIEMSIDDAITVMES